MECACGRRADSALRELFVLALDPGLVPSTQTGQLTAGALDPLLTPRAAELTCAPTHTHIYTIKKKTNLKWEWVTVYEAEWHNLF